MKKLWAISVVATRESPIGFDTRHTVTMVEAVSKDEAVGVAWRVGRKLLPPGDGWTEHSVLAHDASVVVDPDTMKPVS